MSAKKIKYLFDGVTKNERTGAEVYARAWADGRSEIAVQVWLSGKPDGEPDGDFGMPKMFGVSASVAQAVLQTEPLPSPVTP